MIPWNWHSVENLFNNEFDECETWRGREEEKEEERKKRHQSSRTVTLHGVQIKPKIKLSTLYYQIFNYAI